MPPELSVQVVGSWDVYLVPHWLRIFWGMLSPLYCVLKAPVGESLEAEKQREMRWMLVKMPLVGMELSTTAVVDIRGGPREPDTDHHKCLLQRLTVCNWGKCIGTLALVCLKERFQSRDRNVCSKNSRSLLVKESILRDRGVG